MSDVKKKLSKKSKALIIVAVVLLAAIVASVITVSVNQAYFGTKITYALMPKSLVAETKAGDIEFFVRLNEDYDAKAQGSTPLQAFEYYYYDSEGKEIDLGPDGYYEDGDEKLSMSLIFSYKAGEKLATVKSVLSKIGWALAAVVFVGLIVIWFLVWSKKQDEEKAAAHKKNNSTKNRKKKN